MFSLSRTRWLIGLGLVVALLTSATTATRGQGAKKANSKNVSFKTYDGVELSGTLYPNPGGKRDATVLLLHDLEKKGGASQKEGWPELAATLQADGYAVLSFDFRGYGESKSVDKEVFWKIQHNQFNVKRTKGGESIEHSQFQGRYLPYLVNDIAAAKAYLDRQNDQKACNTSSLIVIGAGEGATLGAMWMAHEARRRKNKNMLVFGPPMLGDPESKDLAAGVWLSMSPKIGTRTVSGNPGSLQRWVFEVGKDNKVPMAFVYGKGDGSGDSISNSLLKTIKPGGAKAKDLQFTGVQGIPDTKLKGRALLTEQATMKWLRGYLDLVMEARGSKEWVERKVDAHGYFYTDRKKPIPQKVNKKPGDEVPSVDVNLFLPS